MPQTSSAQKMRFPTSSATRDMFRKGPSWLRKLGPLLLFTFCFVALGPVESFSQEVLIKRSQYLMGTLVFVTGVAPQEEVAKKAVAAGLAEIRRIELFMSTWIPDSELSKVNMAAGKQVVKVGPENMEVLKASLRMAALTDHGFNIAVGACG